jgi:DNA-binding transcriptional LysR family regulator
VQNSTMDWDDVRLFLELVRRGSARSAAAALGMSHSTIVRRVERLETNLDVRLFDRDFRGYRPTAAGETLLTSALAAEDAILAADRQLHGQDTRLTGEIRITTSDVLANYFMMPDLTEFSNKYPAIDLSLNVSYDLFDLSRREADVAIRFMRLNKNPPEELVGRKLITATSCYYATEQYLESRDPWSDDTTARWVGWGDDEPFPDWVKTSAFPHVPAVGDFGNVMVQATAARSGLGLSVLPCFVGDFVSGIVRIPGCEPYDNYDIWMLSHPDLRDAARHRVFRNFIAEAFAAKRGILLGIR